MTVLMIACSRRAYALMQRLEQDWKEEQKGLTAICLVKCQSLPEQSVRGSIGGHVREWFDKVDAIVFFCAVGIAVRSIAPCIRHKSSDPAVLVIDEAGKFCIPLLSGHTGGANALAEKLAAVTGAIPVITTATDREGIFSVDDFAGRNNLTVASWGLVKRISADLLEGGHIRFCTELPVEGVPPAELWINDKIGEFCCASEERAVWISSRCLPEEYADRVLQLIPRRYVLGLGCRKGISKEKISMAVEAFLTERGLLPAAISAVTSIDLKSEEEGLLDYCREKRLPLLTFSAEELNRAEGDFSESLFVEQVTGVSCVCERSAVTAARGELLCGKQVYDGVTLALAERECEILF